MNGLSRMPWMVATLLLIMGAPRWASAAGDPFIGAWKLNSSMSRMPDEMTVESKGGNTYSFDFGGGAETVVVDGTGQPGKDGTTLSVKADAPDTWTVERKKDGRLLLTATWKLSDDGGTLTDSFRQFQPDGSTLSMDYVYQRSGGGSGFAADWRSTKETMNSPFVLQVKAYQKHGLSFIFITPLGHTTRNMELDGRVYPTQGSHANPRSSMSSRRIDEHTLEMTSTVGGTVTDRRDIRLSPDGKTLTMTVHAAGRSKPNVMVFDRE
jgi:hypothetical protein